MVRAVRLWRTRRPVTFREKVRYKMLRDHRALVVTFADKVAVRDHIASLVGAEHLPALYAVLDDAARLADLDLPIPCVVKPTHGSGAAVIISADAPDYTTLPEPGEWTYRHVRPSAVDRARLAELACWWTAQLYGQGPNREWVYGRVPRRVLVEEFLSAPDDGVPDDYKFFVFHGRCHFVQVDRGRFGGRTQDFFTPDWTHLALSGGPPWADPPVPRPDRLGEMLDLAERLGVGTDFVRVDMYLLPDRVVIGELTSFPAGGDSPFDPESFDLEFGRPWTVPRRYR